MLILLILQLFLAKSILTYAGECGPVDVSFDPVPLESRSPGAPDLKLNLHWTTLDGSIADFLPQPDGKVVIVGQFSRIRDRARYGIARLNVDGSLDEGFDAGNPFGANPNHAPQYSYRLFLIQSDGKLVVGRYRDPEVTSLLRFTTVRIQYYQLKANCLGRLPSSNCRCVSVSS